MMKHEGPVAAERDRRRDGAREPDQDHRRARRSAGGAAALSAWLVFRDPPRGAPPTKRRPYPCRHAPCHELRGTIDRRDLTYWTLPLAPWRGIDAVHGSHSARNRIAAQPRDRRQHKAGACPPRLRVAL